MKISVLIALFNRENYIEKAIQSVLSQTFTDFEIIIVDDGSDDNSLLLAQKFKDERIRIFSQTHEGCWKTKNRTILEAKGDFVLFLDSDDFLAKDYLEIAFLYSQKFPEDDYFYPLQLQICREDGFLTKSMWKYLDVKIEERTRLIEIFFREGVGAIPHAGALIKRDLFQRIGLYNDELFNFSDTEFIIRNAEKIRFNAVPNLNGYFNRQHEKQTNKNAEEKGRSINFILNFIIENFPREYYFKNYSSYNNSMTYDIDYYDFVIEKFRHFIEISAPFNSHFLTSAKKFILKKRQLESSTKFS